MNIRHLFFQGFTSDWVLTGTAVAVVPEPEAYALMLAGLGLIAGAVRRRRNSGATLCSRRAE